MSDKNIFNKNETIKPMSKQDFDYKKHYTNLMDNYCEALSTIEALEERVKELEEKQRWIPASERLPD